jgi:hypothetical protein
MPEVPDNTLLAIYFALCAARRGTTRIVITNDTLKYYFFGNEKGRRLSEARIVKWAETLKPILRHKVARSQHGPHLVRYVNEQASSLVSTKAVRLVVPPRATIYKALELE